MREIFARFDVPIKLFLVLGLLIIGSIEVFSIFNKAGTTDSSEDFSAFGGQLTAPQSRATFVETCEEECESKIRELVAEAVATLSAEKEEKSTPAPKPAIQPVAQTQPKTSQVSYVPVGSSGSTTKTDWADLLNTDFFLDIGEYGKVKEARWTATLKIFQNGEAFVRLFDATHGVAVPGSELSTKNTSYTLIESGTLTFLSGKSVYRVQMKSLTGYEASFDSGKIKIISEQ